MINKNNLYFKKYIKYKNKYKNLVNQKGGECDNIEEKENLNDIDVIMGDPLFDDNIHPYNRITFGKQCYIIKELYKWVLSNRGANEGLEHEGRELKGPTHIPCLTFPDTGVELTKEELNKLLIAFNDIPETERYTKNDPNDVHEPVVPLLENTITLTEDELVALGKEHKEFMPVLSTPMTILNYLKIKYEINDTENTEFKRKLKTLDDEITDLLNGKPKYDKIIPIIKTHVNNLIEHPKYIFLSDYKTEFERVSQINDEILKIIEFHAQQSSGEQVSLINMDEEKNIHQTHLADIATHSNLVIRSFKDLEQANKVHTDLIATPKEVVDAIKNAYTRKNKLHTLNIQLKSIESQLNDKLEKYTHAKGELLTLYGEEYEKKFKSSLENLYSDIDAINELKQTQRKKLIDIYMHEIIIYNADKSVIAATYAAPQQDGVQIKKALDQITIANANKTKYIKKLKAIQDSVQYYK